MTNISFILISESSVRIEKITKVIRKFHFESEIFSTDNMHTGLDLALVNKPALIFCDEKIKGNEVLDFYHQIISQKIREKIYFVVVSDHDDFDQLQKYIDLEFDDYLIGHERTQIIYNRIKLGVKILSLKLKIMHENLLLKKMSKQLEEDLNNILKISTKFIQARLPVTHEMLKDISDTSVWIAEKFNQLSKQDIKDIEIASYFCQAGRLFLPDNLLKTPVMSNGRVVNSMMNQIPIVSKDIVSSIEKFENVGKILHHLYENLDGTGIPNQIQSWQIPLGSRIIRAVLDFEENMFFNGLDPISSINKLKGRINRIYDGRVINLLEEYIEKNGKHVNIENDFPLLLTELKPNMIISREIKANSGLKLMNSGIALTEKNIQMLINHSSTDPILGRIYVYRDSIPELEID